MSVSHPIAGRDLFEHPAMKGIKRNSICIFISHDRYEDGETAELLAATIKKSHKVETYVTSADIKPGGLWPFEVMRKLQQATNCIFIVTDNWLKSAECSAEYHYAANRYYREELPKMHFVIQNVKNAKKYKVGMEIMDKYPEFIEMERSNKCLKGARGKVVAKNGSINGKPPKWMHRAIKQGSSTKMVVGYMHNLGPDGGMTFMKPDPKNHGMIRKLMDRYGMKDEDGNYQMMDMSGSLKSMSKDTFDDLHKLPADPVELVKEKMLALGMAKRPSLKRLQEPDLVREDHPIRKKYGLIQTPTIGEEEDIDKMIEEIRRDLPPDLKHKVHAMKISSGLLIAVGDNPDEQAREVEATLLESIAERKEAEKLKAIEFYGSDKIEELPDTFEMSDEEEEKKEKEEPKVLEIESIE